MYGTGRFRSADDLRWVLIAGLVLINVIWGGTFVVKRLALNDLTPIEIVSMRYFLAAPLMVLITYLWKGKEALRVEKRDLVPMAIMAVTGVVLQQLLQVWAQMYTSTTNVSLLANTTTFFTLLLGFVILREKLTTMKLAGTAIGFVGVLLLVGNQGFDLNAGSHYIGDGMIITAAILWSVYMITGKGVTRKYHPATIISYTFAMGALILLPFYLLGPHTAVTASGMAYVLFLAVVSSVFADLVLFAALKRMEASRVTSFVYLIPLSGVALSVIVLHEHLTLMTLLGSGAILYGMYLAQK